jgi:hypothetical protein
MAFTPSVDAVLAKRWDGADWNEENLTLTQAGSVYISQGAGSATYTISGAGVEQADLDTQLANYLPLSGGTMTGFITLHADPTADLHAVTKQYVDNAAQNAAVEVKDDTVTVVNSAGSLDFGHGIQVASGVGDEADISVKESELTEVVFLSGTQTVSGEKTFADNMQVDANLDVQGDLSVQGTTTTINTETLLVEDNIVTLNTTHTGTPQDIDAGLEVLRGSGNPYAQLLWDEGDDCWKAGISGSLDCVVLQADLTALSGLVDQNSTDITTLSGLIVQNASDISTVSGLTVQNASDISTVSGLTVQNASDITTLSGLIVQNASDISTVSGLTVQNASDITTLSGLIVQNQSDISTVSGLTVQNATDITTLSGLIDQNATDISTVSGLTVQNASDIQTVSGLLAGYLPLSGGVMTGFITLHADPTADLHAVTKQYVDNVASNAAIEVQDDDVTAVSGANVLDFGRGLTVTSGAGGEADIVVNEPEFENVVFTSGVQTVSGQKTFADTIVLASGSAPGSTGATGLAGEFRFDDDYVYFCVSTDRWKRAPISVF